MTQSRINLYTFATLAFGGKWVGNFRWLHDNPSYLFTNYKPNPDGTFDKYYLFNVYKEMYRQSKNLGPHLVRLVSDDVAIVKGRQIKNGLVVENEKPADNPVWTEDTVSALNRRVHINNIQVEAEKGKPCA